MKTLKLFVRPFLTGVVLAALLALIMLKVTMNFQWLLCLGAILFFGAGLFNARAKTIKWFSAFIILFMYTLLFALLVLPQLPKLYYFILIYFIACLLGLYFYSERRKSMIYASALTVVILVLAIKVVPRQIESSLTHLKLEPLPKFVFTDLEGNTISTDQLKGKVVILDFFGTWCAPCRKELPELQKVKDAIQNKDEVVFYVVNADIGGDTPEKFKTFIANHKYDFNYIYDEGSRIYKLLNLEYSGLPTLLVIDKQQNIRMHHVGYNDAEIHFADNLIELIKNLD